jgi:hypothetical protein
VNTKQLDRAGRKRAKREARLKLKELFSTMTRDERKKLALARESKPALGMKKFVLDLRKPKA